MNTTVNFELAKLLKENGYDNECDYAYLVASKYGLIGGLNVKPDEIVLLDMRKEKFYDTLKNSIYKEHVTFGVSNYIASAPTIADVIMWIWGNYGIWIEARIDITDNRFTSCVDEFYLDKFDTSSEAYNDAITYILNGYSLLT